MTKSVNSKPSNLLVSIWTVKVFVGAVAAAGVNSYVQSGPAFYPMAVVAGLTAIVIMMTADHVGRNAASYWLVPLLVICGLFQAANLEHSYQFYLEQPAKAAYETGLKPLQAEVDRSTERLTKAQASLDAFAPESVDCSPCRNTRREAAERDAARRNPLSAAVEVAKADRKIALDALQTAQHGYKPFADSLIVLVLGGLLDAAALASIAAMAGIARRDREEYEARLAAEAKAEAERLEAEAKRLARQTERKKALRETLRAKEREARRKAKEKAAKAAAKAKPPQGFTPYLIAAND